MKNPLARWFGSMLELVRTFPHRKREPMVTPEQFRRMLEETLAADPNLARRVLRPLVGTVFPLQGAACTTKAAEVGGGTPTERQFGSDTACGGGDYSFPANLGIGASPASSARVDIDFNSGTWAIKGKRGATGDLFGIHANGANPVVLETLGARDLKLRTGTTDNVLYLKDNGNVGIGTLGPGYRLQVAGNAYFEQAAGVGAVPTAGRWLNVGSSTYGVYIAGGTTAALAVASGNVGIGTTNPGAKLEVAESGTAEVRIKGTTSSQKPLLSFYHDSTLAFYIEVLSAAATKIWNQANQPIAFGTNDAERVRIAADGKVGIGTTTPKRPLHVNGGDAVVHEGGGFGFMEGTKDDPTTILYRVGGSTAGVKDITRLRNWNVGQSNPPVYTILELRAPTVPSGDPTREATLSLVRVDSQDANLEFLDLYNVRTNNPPIDSKTMGIRIARVGTGDFSDFVIEQARDGSVENTFMFFDHGKNIVIAPDAGKVGIGTSIPQTTVDVDGAIRSTLTTVSSSPTPTFNAALGNSFKITLGQNISPSITNGQAGQIITILFCQDGTGGRSVTSWPTNLKLAGGSFNLTSAANKCDVLTAIYDGTNWYEVARAINE